MAEKSETFAGAHGEAEPDEIDSEDNHDTIKDEGFASIRSLAASATSLRSHFKQIDQTLTITLGEGSDYESRSREQSGRFLIWMAETGTFRKDPNSPDALLANVPHIVEQARSLLDCLEETLDELAQLLNYVGPRSEHQSGEGGLNVEPSRCNSSFTHQTRYCMLMLRISNFF